MYTSFSTTRRVIPVLTISILLSSMSALLSASSWNRVNSARPSVDGETKVSQPLAPPQSRGEAVQSGHVSHSLPQFKSKKGASSLVFTFNIAYDSITNGITAGILYG